MYITYSHTGLKDNFAIYNMYKVNKCICDSWEIVCSETVWVIPGLFY